MLPILRRTIFWGLLLSGLLACSHSPDKPPPTQSGLESTDTGIKIVANYDSRFDKILEHYRLLTITFANQSPNLIELDGKKDIWTVTTRNGAQIKAINNLRFVDVKAWENLSSKAQELIEYPRVVLRNTTVTFDVLFPKSVDLNDFRKVDFFCQSLNKKFVGASSYGELPE